MADVYASAYSNRVAATATFRTRAEVARFFEGFELLEPGLVWTDEWRPDSTDDAPDLNSAIRGVAGVGKYAG